MNNEDIKNRIHSLYPDARIEVSGEGCDVAVFIISDDFQGMPIMRRQKAILQLFREELTANTLHALSVKAKTNAEANAGSSNLVQLEM